MFSMKMSMTTNPSNLKSQVKMKHSLIKYMVAAMAVTSAAGVSAQNRSAYFLENYAYNYQLNPAMAIDRSYDISFPGLGNVNLGVMSNVGVNSFVFKLPDGKLTSFMNPMVDAGKFMDGLHERNRLGFEARVGVMSVGFRALGGYNHVSVNVVSNAQVRVPKSLFSFLKEGVTNRTYDIGRVDVYADAYAEVALNHSHSLDNILPGLRVGGSFKFLVGLTNMDFNMDKADLRLGRDQWTAITSGTLHLNMKDVAYKTYLNNEGMPYVDGVDVNSFGPCGYGMAVDLGASYRLNSDWDFALAFNDIGFINWTNDVVASTNGERYFTTADYPIDPSDYDSTMDALTDGLSSLYQLSDNGNMGSRCRALAATMNVSARYTLPVYRNLTFGLLNTTRMARRYAWTDFRLSANVTPVKWLSAGINYGIGTFGSSFGWILNIAPKGFNFYVGMDHTLGKFAKQYVPINLNGQLSVGINFPI